MDLNEARQKLRQICLDLPQAVEVEAWGDPTYRVRGKIFAMEKGAGTEVWFKAATGMQRSLLESGPACYFVPPYVGHKGWVGARLDRDLDWEELGDLVEQSYRLIAPKTLVAALNSPTAPPATVTEYQVQPIGRVSSPLTDPVTAPKQGDEGSPDAWLEFAPTVEQGLTDLRPGDDVFVLTWLHQAQRNLLAVHPRGDPSRPLTGVFSTRSPDRPNPIGLHRVTILTINGLRVKVANLEALDGTPILDVKPVLHPGAER